MAVLHSAQRRALQQRGLSGSSRRRDLELLAGISLAAAAVTALIRAQVSFEHGTWLVAYLFLVGFLAQLLLGRGQAALLAHAGAPPAGTRRAQAALWNLGVVAVPLGVFADARLGVVGGAVALLAALVSFQRTAASSAPAAQGLRRWYLALILFMGTSALVGVALAWDVPWL